MPDATHVELLYGGSEVEDGTVPVEDMVDALVGFSGAYDKIARNQQGSDIGHRIRVVGLQKGSAKIVVDVVEWVAKNPAAAGVLVTGASVVGAGAYKVLTDLAGVIRGKKALQGQSITNNYTVIDNRVRLGGIDLTPEQFEYLQSGELDSDLDTLTAPLGKNRGIDQFELKAGDKELVKVSAEERPYLVQPKNLFALPGVQRERVKVAKTEYGVGLDGTFKSHSKRSNSGRFQLLSGKTIRYRYRNSDLQPLLRAYASTGVVKVFGKVKFDPSGEPISIEIRDVQHVPPPVTQQDHR
jgi:hypothetical protein